MSIRLPKSKCICGNHRRKFYDLHKALEPMTPTLARALGRCRHWCLVAAREA